MTTEKIRIEIIGGTQQIIDLIESIKGSQIVVSSNCNSETGEGAIASSLSWSTMNIPETRTEKTDRERGEAISAALKQAQESAVPPEEQVLSVADPETWGVGDVVRLREDSDGSGSAYWRVGFCYLIAEKTAHGTIFVTQDKGDPIEISMGIAQRWFRLARKAEKVDEQCKNEGRKPHKSRLGLREFLFGSHEPSLRDVSCGIHMTAHDVSEGATTKSYVDVDGNKFTEKTYGLPSSMLAEERYQVQIDILEETVASLRAELKERKEDGAQMTVVRIDKDMLLGLSLLRPGEAVCFRDRKLTIIME